MQQNLGRSTYKGRLICSVQRGMLSTKICLGPDGKELLQKMQLHSTLTSRSKSVGSICKHVSRIADSHKAEPLGLLQRFAETYDCCSYEFGSDASIQVRLLFALKGSQHPPFNHHTMSAYVMTAQSSD